MTLDFIDDIIGDNFLSFFLKVFKMLCSWATQLWNIITAQVFTIDNNPVYFWELLIAVGALAIITRALINWLV